MSKLKGTIRTVLLGGFAGYLVYESLLNVPPDYSALVFNQFSGFKDQVYKEGMHLKVPFVERPVFYNLKPKSILIQVEGKDEENLGLCVPIKITYRPDPNYLRQLNLGFGPQYDRMILPPVAHEAFQKEFVKYGVHLMSTHKEEMNSHIQKNIIEKCREFHIIVEDAFLDITL